MDESTKASVETVIATISSKVTYTGASGSVIGYLLSSEFTVILGSTLALLGFIVNLYYRYKADKRAQAEHYAKMGMYE